MVEEVFVVVKAELVAVKGGMVEEVVIVMVMIEVAVKSFCFGGAGRWQLLTIMLKTVLKLFLFRSYKEQQMFDDMVRSDEQERDINNLDGER